MEKTNYMMTVDDVAQELGVSKQKGYRIIRQLNEELAAAGYMTVQAKVPRTYWSERFYFGKRNIVIEGSECRMAVSKGTEKGTWTSQIWVEDWQGKKKHKKKRGFASKKEALECECNTLLASKTDMNMKLADFVEVYFRDKDGELKQRTIRNKRYMIEHHIIPLLGNKAMDSITPADIIQWQNEIRSKGFKETYQRMLQNQMTALFTHATKIYNLKDNPCMKVKRMGRADADKKQLQFWTLDEFNCFIGTFDLGSKYHVLFDLLFYNGCRIGEALALTASDIDTTNRRISITNSNFAHRFSLCTLKIQYWQLFSYLNSYAMLLEAVSSVKQVPCS